jgi:hypothetical protein
MRDRCGLRWEWSARPGTEESAKSEQKSADATRVVDGGDSLTSRFSLLAEGDSRGVVLEATQQKRGGDSEGARALSLS